MSYINSNTSSKDEKRYNDAENQKALTELKAQQNDINYQRMWLNFYNQAAQGAPVDGYDRMFDPSFLEYMRRVSPNTAYGIEQEMRRRGM